jgi:cytochrome c553
MRRVVRWIAFAMAGALIVIVIGLTSVYALSSRAISKQYSVTVPPLSIPADSASIARGRHIATAVSQCVNCHGENLGGKVFVDNAVMGQLYAANLTPGKGGIGRSYSDTDYTRAIRHGIGRDGRPLLAMPSDAFFIMSDADLASVVAYLKTLPAVDAVLPAKRIGPLARALYVATDFPLVPAEEIPHDQPRPVAVAQGVNRDYGSYLATIGGCKSCHLKDLNGGVPVEGNVMSANLTPTGIGKWTQADFVRAMRSGTRPDGRVLSAAMPWPYMRLMTDDELAALWLYLRALPPKDSRGR